MAIGNGPEVPQTEMGKKAIFCNCAFALCEVLNLVVIFAGQTKRCKCHQHTGQAEFLRKTQLQIVDIEADNGHDKKHFSRNWKSVGKKYIKQHCSEWVNISYFKEGLNGTPKGVPAVA